MFEKANEPDSHNSECSCDLCSGKYTPQELIQMEKEFLKDPGWYAHIVNEDPDSPTGFNYHTHGFVTANHLNIQIVLPIHPDICHAIANIIYRRIKIRGQKFQAGKRYSKIIEPDGVAGVGEDDKEYEVMFIKVTECGRPVLRIIFPDKEGNVLARDMIAESPDYALQWTP